MSRNHNGAIDRVEANIARWQGQLAVQRPIAALECRGYTAAANPKVWPKCMTARALIANYEAKLDGAHAQRARLGERVSVGRHSERVVGWLFGSHAGRAVILMQPVLIAGLLEVGTALMLCLAGLFATRNSDQGRVTTEPVATDSIREALRRGPASNRELARRLGWSESRTSRHVRRLDEDGAIRCARDGRQKLIALVPN